MAGLIARRSFSISFIVWRDTPKRFAISFASEFAIWWLNEKRFVCHFECLCISVPMKNVQFRVFRVVFLLSS